MFPDPDDAGASSGLSVLPIRFAAAGQINFEGASLCGFAVDVDKAVVLLDDAINRGQAQPRAFADFLGCKKWFKNIGEMIFVHADAGVADRQQDILTGDDIRDVFRQ